MGALDKALAILNPNIPIIYTKGVDAEGNEVVVKWLTPSIPQPTRAQIDAVIPAAKAALIMSAIRAERDRRLAATDYMAMPDYPNKPANLSAYRQALRDFPATVNVAALSCPPDVSVLNWPVL